MGDDDGRRALVYALGEVVDEVKKQEVRRHIDADVIHSGRIDLIAANPPVRDDNPHVR